MMPPSLKLQGGHRGPVQSQRTILSPLGSWTSAAGWVSAAQGNPQMPCRKTMHPAHSLQLCLVLWADKQGEGWHLNSEPSSTQPWATLCALQGQCVLAPGLPNRHVAGTTPSAIPLGSKGSVLCRVATNGMQPPLRCKTRPAPAPLFTASCTMGRGSTSTSQHSPLLLVRRSVMELDCAMVALPTGAAAGGGWTAHQQQPGEGCGAALPCCHALRQRLGARSKGSGSRGASRGPLPLIIGGACLLLGLAFSCCMPQSVLKAAPSAAAIACRSQRCSEAAVPRSNIRGEVPAMMRNAQAEAGPLQPGMLLLSQPCVRGAQTERPVLGEQLVQQPDLLQRTQAGACAERHGFGEQHWHPDKPGLRQPSRGEAHTEGAGLGEPSCRSSQEGPAGRGTAQEQLHLQSPWQAENGAEPEARLAGPGFWQPDVWEQDQETAEAQGLDAGADCWHNAAGRAGTAAGARGLTRHDTLREQSSRLQGETSRAGASRRQT